MISKQKEIFNKLVDEEITKLNKEVNSDDLIYRYKGSSADEIFLIKLIMHLDKIRDGKISLPAAKKWSRKI